MKKSNPQKYIQSLYVKRNELLDKLDDTKRRKVEFSSRYSSASQRRMQALAVLGSDSAKAIFLLHPRAERSQH